MDHRLFLFPSTYQALAAEDALRRGGIDLQVIPTPRRYTSGCGLAIRVPATTFEASRDILTGKTVRFTVPPDSTEPTETG
jgi:Protein of unknown function (DUF3343).